MKKRQSDVGGISAIPMKIDAAFCLLKYGATFHDYIIMRFYLLPEEERKKYLTTKMVQREKKKWDWEAFEKVDNKRLFNETFSVMIGREWIALDDSTYDEFLNFYRKTWGCFF